LAAGASAQAAMAMVAQSADLNESMATFFLVVLDRSFY
jgi:hypothetical protein